MISIDEATKIIRNHTPTPLRETIHLEEASGRVLAQEICAPGPSPRYTNSAMDGIAVRWQDVKNVLSGKTVELNVIGESCAGSPFMGSIQQGQAVTINTGAMLPEGADTVIPLENMETSGDIALVTFVLHLHQHVRFQGEEIRKGESLLKSGDLLTPARIGLLASFGLSTLTVYKRPTLSIVTSGAELVSIDNEIKPWQLYDSNSIMLTTAVRESGGSVTFSVNVDDKLEEIKAALEKALKNSDVILISGGVSVGPHDLVKQAAKEIGFKSLFWRIRQKPGKPLFFALRSSTRLFGLPGNPVSALNCFAYYVHPVIQKMSGKEFSWQKEEGILSKPIENKIDRALFLRVKLLNKQNAVSTICPLEKQQSHMLTSMAFADGFIILEPGQFYSAGSSIDVFIYPWSH